ncbi:type IV toxin-antitoxin system AbiEi family antitoxin domain-containing protein [Gordonia terrae]
MQSPAELRRIALAHDGVVTAADARASGLDRTAVARRVAAGAWSREARGVYTLADHPVTARTRVRLAVLRAGPHAVLSGVASVWWQGLADAPPRTVTISVPRGHHRHDLRGVHLRYRCLDDADVLVRSGLRVTALPLAVLEASLEDSISVVDNALLRRRVSMRQLRDATARRTGSPDAPGFRRVLDALGSGARSEAERVAVSLLEEAAIGGWIANHPTDGYTADFAFPGRHLIVEIDGFAHHRDADAFQYDRKRRNDLLAAGWTVLNFTWADLTERSDDVAARIRNALTAE